VSIQLTGASSSLHDDDELMMMMMMMMNGQGSKFDANNRRRWISLHDVHAGAIESGALMSAS